MESGLENIFHDDLIPIRTADPMGRFISKWINAAWTMKTPSAVQAIIREGAQGQLLLIPLPEKAFPSFLKTLNETRCAAEGAFSVYLFHPALTLSLSITACSRGFYPNDN